MRRFLGQLGRIDWKQKGVPLEQIRLIAPNIELLIYEKAGIHRDYDLGFLYFAIQPSSAILRQAADGRHPFSFSLWQKVGATRKDIARRAATHSRYQPPALHFQPVGF